MARVQQIFQWASKPIQWLFPRASAPAGPRNIQKRRFEAGIASRLTNDWITLPLSQDAELRTTLRMMRARARSLEQNNDYFKKFLHMVEANVIGAKGIILQNRALLPDGTRDELVNGLIQDAWNEWGRMQNCTMSGKQSWHDVQRLVATSLARDGEVIIRKIKHAGNKFGFALHVYEADHLDEYRNIEELPNGNQVRMGVEVDKWGKVAAYHFTARHPGDYSYFVGSVLYDRIPASEMMHIFIPSRAEQSRGVPWGHSIMTRTNILGGYEEAELVAARAEACKMGFVTSPDGGGFEGEDKDSQGNTLEDVAPGSVRKLPQGTTFTPYDPTHPGGNFGPFVKSMLRGISSGLNVSYNSLASDLEGVNFSSIRQGVIEEREGWKMIQTFLIDHLCVPIFMDWIETAVMVGALGPLKISDLDRFMKPRFHPRGWPWVDPRADAAADLLAVQSGMMSRTRICAEQGYEWEDIAKEIAYENEVAKKLDISLEPTKQTITVDNATAAPGDGTGEGESKNAQNGNGKKNTDLDLLSFN